MTATELCAAGIPSAPRQLGRHLTLKFTGEDHAELDRIEFRYKEGSPASYWQRGDMEHNFSWTAISHVLSLLFLDYVRLWPGDHAEPFFFTGERTGSLAATLGDAIYQPKHGIHDLFVQPIGSHGKASFVQTIFRGVNVHGKSNRERRISVNPDQLAPDCIEVFWELRGPLPLTNSADLQKLRDRIRRSLGLPLQTAPEQGREDKTLPTQARSAADRPQDNSSQPATPLPVSPVIPPPQSPEPHPVILPEAFLKNLEQIAALALKAGQCAAQDTTSDQSQAPSKPQTPTSKPAPKFLRPKVPSINPSLFNIFNPKWLSWDNSQGLLDFGDNESGDDIWRLKDAYEGVLILGAPGSGKTSASGFAFAQAFLTVGMGGLVLCAKPEEARRWQDLCTRFGRAEDCIVVTPGGPHKLNLLSYEIERPRESLGLTDDLIAFFRVLTAIISRRAASQSKEDFWTNATNQLMRELFDVFLLSGEPLTIDGLTQFITHAPDQPQVDWPEIPVFGELLVRAEQGITSVEDQRVYDRIFDYWIVTYPQIAPQTRSGVVMGFTAMANALGGRGIYELISTGTTLTPEMILSGKIVILDLPLKTCGQGGLLIQAAWKYLFQRAIEGRADKGMPDARPVFLWEDEGHLFFSQHDIEFQPTARDCRAAHVILSQSLHNFFHLGHSPHAVEGVFASMNTHIYHANGDLQTAKWASEKLGTAMKTKVNVSVSSQPKQSAQPRHWFWDAFKPEERESSASTSIERYREAVFQPEEFAQLKKGGDGTAQAVIFWMSHQFKANEGRPFCVTTFAQDTGQ